MKLALPPNDFLCVTSEVNIPLQWRSQYRSLLRLRTSLLRKHSEHSAAACTPHETGGNDLIDVANEEQEHATLLAELSAEDSALTEVEAALIRLHNGTYGFCEETGEPISSTRLKVIPWTRFSRAAAARREQSRRKVT